MTERMRRGLAWAGLIVAVAVIAAAAVIGVAARGAQAHDFYSTACCSGRDCALAAPGDVTWSPSGYRVRSTGETIPAGDRRIQFSPPGEPGFRLCVPPYDGKVRCLYVPETQG